MPIVLAIDPGPVESGWCYLDTDTMRPLSHGKDSNVDVLELTRLAGERKADMVVIEQVESYGMPVGKEVFDTVLWCGRFYEALACRGTTPRMIGRTKVKLHFCHSVQAGDASIRHALIDRFAYNVGNFGKGTKKAPGWFYGFRNDVWSAYALAVLLADIHNGGVLISPGTAVSFGGKG